MRTQRTTTHSQAPTTTIVIPALPPKEASPNWRGHWTAKYKATKAYKTLVYYVAKQSIRPTHPTPATHATIRVTEVIPDKRYTKDADNAIASLKAAIDAIVEAGILTDDKDIQVMPVRYKIDKQRAPQTIIEIEPTMPTRRRRTPPHTTRRHTEGAGA